MLIKQHQIDTKAKIIIAWLKWVKLEFTQAELERSVTVVFTNLSLETCVTGKTNSKYLILTLNCSLISGHDCVKPYQILIRIDCLVTLTLSVYSRSVIN